MAWLSNVANTIFAPFSSGVLTPTYSLSMATGRLSPNTAATTVYFVGVSTRWLSSSPILGNSGVAGITTGSVIVDDDTHFHVDVTTGSATGTITWTDSRYGITATQTVGTASRNNAEIVALMWRRRREQTTIKIR